MSDDFYAFLRGFSASLPDLYQERYDALAVADHARLAFQRGTAPRVGRFRSHRAELGVAVITDDQPGLLSRIAGAFVRSDLDVMSADIYTREVAGGCTEAVDLFWVRRRQGLADDDDLRRFRLELVRGLGRDPDAVAALPAASVGRGGVRVRFVEDRGNIVAVDVEALDGRGLLHALSRALFHQRLTIVASDVRTSGSRILDRFHVREMDGAPVPAWRGPEIRAALIAALGERRGELERRDSAP